MKAIWKESVVFCDICQCLWVVRVLPILVIISVSNVVFASTNLFPPPNLIMLSNHCQHISIACNQCRLLLILKYSEYPKISNNYLHPIIPCSKLLSECNYSLHPINAMDAWNGCLCSINTCIHLKIVYTIFFNPTTNWIWSMSFGGYREGVKKPDRLIESIGPEGRCFENLIIKYWLPGI